MMKRLLLILCLFVGVGANAQPMLFNSFGPVYVDGQITGYPNGMIFVSNGNVQQGKVAVDTIFTDEEGKFVWDSAIPFTDFYLFNFNGSNPISIILQANDSLTLTSDIKDVVGSTHFERSNDNELLYDFTREFVKFKSVQDSLRLVVKKDPSRQATINQEFKPVADKFIRYRANFINNNQESPAIAATLNSFDQKQEWKQYTEVVRLLNTSFASSPTLKNINAYVLQKNKEIEAEKKRMAAFQPGMVAPEIVVPDTSGVDSIRLSDLRGKVVLIDFWASWCKPCRMENPNVVKAYNKYKDDGFTVFSVSLDNPGQKSRWLGAIKQDGLIWPNHGSDLKGWQSAPAKQYNVKGIPFTVLVDQEGKIIGTNIRGPQLEQQLKTIFGH